MPTKAVTGKARLASYEMVGPCWMCGKAHSYDRRQPNVLCEECKDKVYNRGSKK